MGRTQEQAGTSGSVDVSADVFGAGGWESCGGRQSLFPTRKRSQRQSSQDNRQ